MANDVVGKLVFQVDVDSKKSVENLNTFQDELKETQEEAKRTDDEVTKAESNISLKGVAIATAVGTAVIKLGKEVIKATAEMQNGQATIVKATGATGEALEGLMQSAKNVYSQTEESFDDVSRAIGEINTRLGYTGDVLEETTGLFLDFADVTNQDVQQSIIDVTQVMNRWNEDAESLPELLDKLTVAGQVSGASVGALTASLTQNAGTLQAMGYSIDEAIAMLMAFEKQGIDSSSVLMGMKKSFEDSAKAGTNARADWEKLMGSIANATDEAEANSLAIDAFGSRIATDMVSALRDGKLGFEDFQRAIENSNGALSATDEASKTTADKLEEMKHKITVSLGELGGAFLPLIETILPYLAKGISALATAVKEITEGIKDAVGYIEDFNSETERTGDNIRELPWLIELALSLGNSATRSMVKSVVELNAEMHDSKEKAKEVAQEMGEFGNKIEEETKVIKENSGAIEDNVDSGKLLIKFGKDAMTIIEDGTETVVKNTDATEENTEEQKEAIRLAEERERTAKGLIDRIHAQTKAEDEERIKTLEASGDIKKAYAIREKAIKDAYETERKALLQKIAENKATYNDLIALQKIYANNIKTNNKNMNEALAKQEQEYTEKAKKEQEQREKDAIESAERIKQSAMEKMTFVTNEMVKLGQQIANIYSQMASNLQTQLDSMNKAREADLQKYREQAEERTNIIEREYEAGKITTEEYKKFKTEVEQELQDVVKKRTDEDMESEKKLKAEINELNRKAFEANKATSIAQAIISGSQAIMTGYAQLGPIGGTVYAGIQVGLTAAQIAVIENQEYVPSYAVGSKYIPRDEMAMLHKGEMVIPREQSDRIRGMGGLDLVERSVSSSLGAEANGLRAIKIDNNLSAVLEVDGTQLGVAVLKNIDNASQFVLR